MWMRTGWWKMMTERTMDEKKEEKQQTRSLLSNCVREKRRTDDKMGNERFENVDRSVNPRSNLPTKGWRSDLAWLSWGGIWIYSLKGCFYGSCILVIGSASWLHGTYATSYAIVSLHIHTSISMAIACVAFRASLLSNRRWETMLSSSSYILSGWFCEESTQIYFTENN